MEKATDLVSCGHNDGVLAGDTGHLLLRPVQLKGIHGAAASVQVSMCGPVSQQRLQQTP